MPTPLLAKLGYRPGTPAGVIARPDGWTLLDALPDASHDGGPVPFLVVFCTSVDDAASRIPAAVTRYVTGGHLWMAYPKKTGRLRTDITRDHGWEPLGAAGFLAVTQVALDETWSALRFRRREEIARITRREPGSARRA